MVLISFDFRNPLVGNGHFGPKSEALDLQGGTDADLH